jgi:hypothetical protein
MIPECCFIVLAGFCLSRNFRSFCLFPFTAWLEHHDDLLYQKWWNDCRSLSERVRRLEEQLELD